MSSDDTFIATTGESRFDCGEVTEIFRAIPAVESIRETEDYAEAEYCYQDIWGTITLLRERPCVVLHGTDDVALAIAVEFAVRYMSAKGVQLQLFNTQYDFHQILSADIDLATLKRQIDEDPFAGARAPEH